MARIRTIKPNFWRHEVLATLPEPALILALSLLNYVDDDGYFNANPTLVKASCSPLRELSLSIQTCLTELQKIEYLRLGAAADGRRYGQIIKFRQHQRINRPTPSEIGGLAIVWEDSVSPHGVLSEPSLWEGNGKEGNGKGKGKGKEAGETVVPIKSKKADEASPQFLEFFVIYPRRVAKEDARKAWKKLKLDNVALAIISDVKRRIDGEWKGWKEDFIPYPAKYLNSKRWEDEISRASALDDWAAGAA